MLVESGVGCKRRIQEMNKEEAKEEIEDKKNN